MKKMFVLVSNRGGLEEKIRDKSRTSDLEPRTSDLITSPDALPLSHRRLLGAKAAKPGSCEKHPASCYDLNIDMCLCAYVHW